MSITSINFTVFWLIAAVVLAIIEATTAQLVSIWFAIGAAAGCITSLFSLSIPIQFLVFAVVSAIALLITRPLVKRIKVKKTEATNADRLIGQEGVITKTVNNTDAKGLVRVGAQIWSARSIDGAPIEEGTLVTVAEIEGVKLIVKPINESN